MADQSRVALDRERMIEELTGIRYMVFPKQQSRATEIKG